MKQKAFIWHCNPIGRDSGFKIRIVWIRLPPVLPTSLTGRNATKSASLVVGVMRINDRDRKKNSCPAKLCNDCGEAKALADKGQPHELEYCAGRLTVGRQTHYLETPCNSDVRTHACFTSVQAIAAKTLDSRRGWILRFNYHRLLCPTAMADNEDMWLCHLSRV